MPLTPSRPFDLIALNTSSALGIIPLRSNPTRNPMVVTEWTGWVP
jgi:hypothetical protein